MAPKKRFSIAFLMAVVFFVAADFAIMNALWGVLPWATMTLYTLPMVNLLLLGWSRARRGLESRRFWLGFEASGWVMVLLFATLIWSIPGEFLRPVVWIREFISLDRNISTPCAIVLYAIPQLLVATLGGWLSARVIGRSLVSETPGGFR